MYFHSQLSVSMHLYKLLLKYIHGQLINIYHSDNISYVEETACSVPGSESAHVCTLSKAEGEAPSWKIGTVAGLGSHVDVVDLMAHGGLRGVLHAVGEGPV